MVKFWKRKGIKVRLIPDKYHLDNVGRTSDGQGVWVCSQLALVHGDTFLQTRDFVCTYFFDDRGMLTDHRIDELGVRGTYAEADGQATFDKHVQEAQLIEPVDLWVHPFKIEFAGLEFGLIEDKLEDGSISVLAMPGNTLSFYPPWEDGLYDT